MMGMGMIILAIGQSMYWFAVIPNPIWSAGMLSGSIVVATLLSWFGYDKIQRR